MNLKQFKAGDDAPLYRRLAVCIGRCSLAEVILLTASPPVCSDAVLSVACQLFLFDRTEFSKLEQQLEDLTGKVIVGGVNLVRMTQLHCKLLQHLFFVRACMCVCAHACVCVDICQLLFAATLH